MGDLMRPISAMAADTVEAVARLEAEVLKLPQVDIETHHAFHAGMYARTIKVPAGVLLTGALIKIPTVLVISGDAVVYTSEGPVEIVGYHVMLGSAGRKQAFVARADTWLTMIFPTTVTTVPEAERQFTNDYDRLFSRRDGATNEIVGEE